MQQNIRYGFGWTKAEVLVTFPAVAPEPSLGWSIHRWVRVAIILLGAILAMAIVTLALSLWLGEFAPTVAPIIGLLIGAWTYLAITD